MSRFLDPAFPWGTLVVNVTGSFLLGAVVHVGLATQWLPPLRLVLTTGVIGGFTTYSTFNETLQYLRQGSASVAMLDIAATLVTLGKVRVLKYAAGPRRT